MLYLETAPSADIAGCIRSLWYTSATGLPHQPERVLPNGCIQVIISLAAEALTDCSADFGLNADGTRTSICNSLPPAILVGARGRYEVIHTRDFAELVGIVFRPGGLGPWLRHPANAFFEQSVSLDALWNTRGLRDRLKEAPEPRQKLAILNSMLRKSLRGRAVNRRPNVQAALVALSNNSVRETAQTLGLSERRLQQLFLEDVGLSPKLWSRIHRFQRAVKALHQGQEIRWDQLALTCGYYDQSHFSNDFHTFSGIDPTTYSELKGQWRNHVVLD